MTQCDCPDPLTLTLALASDPSIYLFLSGQSLSTSSSLSLSLAVYMQSLVPYCCDLSCPVLSCLVLFCSVLFRFALFCKLYLVLSCLVSSLLLHPPPLFCMLTALLQRHSQLFQWIICSPHDWTVLCCTSTWLNLRAGSHSLPPLEV